MDGVEATGDEITEMSDIVLCDGEDDRIQINPGVFEQSLVTAGLVVRDDVVEGDVEEEEEKKDAVVREKFQS